MTEATYNFNSDGTFEYLLGSDNFFNGQTCSWRVNGNVLELVEGSNKPYSLIFQKKNDSATGKPELFIQFRGNEYRDYISLDNKVPWK